MGLGVNPFKVESEGDWWSADYVVSHGVGRTKTWLRTQPHIPWRRGGEVLTPSFGICHQRRCIIRNISAAPICNQFSVVPPGSWIGEVYVYWD